MPSRSVEKSSDTGSLMLSPGASSSNGKETEHYENIPRDTHQNGDGYDVTTPEYPNRWAKYRMMIREPAAEFFGVAIMIIFGNGVDCQAVLSMNPKVASFPRGDYLSLNFGWAVGVAMGVYTAGGISGAHLNPAVTLALATFRGFPWRKVPAYALAQLLGALVGSALVYANYIHAIDLVEGGRHIRTISTGSLFSTYTLDYMTNVSAFFSEFLAAAVLMLVILAMLDPANMPAPHGLSPLVLFMLILGIGAALGMETGYAINPARDLGPRLMTAMVGYGTQVFTFRNHYWLWCPIIAPILGCQAGALLYDMFLFTGKESVLNKPSKKVRPVHPEQGPGIPA